MLGMESAHFIIDAIAPAGHAHQSCRCCFKSVVCYRQAHFILDEMVMNGAIIETNKNNILAPVHLLDKAGASSS